MKDLSLDPVSRFGFRLVGVARRWRRRLDETLGGAGFADASWVPLVHLAEGGGVTQHELAERCGLDDSSLVRLIDALVARGLVERRPKPTDRRAKCVHLTGAGAAAVTRIRAVLLATEREMLDGVETAELARADAVLDRIEAALARLADAGEPT
ncbi:MAG: MarR family transcriptional regulator [Phyllobacteriaceae bacterium]|nr:MarR family transcriptional regulator [Phyllobacteriaceae bacterium]